MVIELFHFRGLFSYGVRLDYFNEPRSLFAAREGDGRMKDKDHHIRHPRGHFGDRASAQGTRGCAWRDDQFGRGQNTVLGSSLCDECRSQESGEMSDTRRRKVTLKKH
jgi:hypothetical protein